MGVTEDQLRIEELRFGNKRVGMTEARPQFLSGENAQLHFKIRGAQADSSGNCRIGFRIRFDYDLLMRTYFEIDERHDEIYARTNLEKDLLDAHLVVDETVYPRRSEITSLDVGPMTFTLPLKLSGEQHYFFVEVTDHVSGQVLEHQVDFSIEVPDIEDDSLRDLWACANNLYTIHFAIEDFEKNRDFSPRTPGDLVPSFLDRIPTCPAAASDTYTEGFTITPTFLGIECRGLNHLEAGATEDFPRLVNGSLSYRLGLPDRTP